jgi:hypothetical protein
VYTTLSSVYSILINNNHPKGETKMELKNLEEMTAYVENKFGGEGAIYKCTARPLDPFGPVVKYHITWTPREDSKYTDTIEGPMWVAPTGYTAAVPFTA